MRKYQTEFALYIRINECYFLRPNNLIDLNPKTVKNCHLYAIISIPRMFIKENSIKKAPDAISFNVHSIGDVFEPISFSLGNTIDHTKVLINTEYPFTAITFEHESIPRPLRLTATYLYTFFHKKITSSSPLEVLYIGQSFGKGGELSARDRLLKHPTLQKILSEYQVDKPR